MMLYVLIGVEYGYEDGDNDSPPAVLLITTDRQEATTAQTGYNKLERDGGYHGAVTLTEYELT